MCRVWATAQMSNQDFHFGSCLPGTELLQSPFRTEFNMGSLSWLYRRSLLHYRRFLRSYRWSLRRYCQSVRCYRQSLQGYRRSLRRCHNPWCNWQPRGRRWRSLCNLMNIVKHNKTWWNTVIIMLFIIMNDENTRKTLWTTHKTLWTTHKTLWTTSKTSWNT